MPQQQESHKTKPEKPLTVSGLLKSAAAAAFGVQSKDNLQTDFSQKSIIPYILIGIVFTALFLLTLILIVSLII